MRLVSFNESLYSILMPMPISVTSTVSLFLHLPRVNSEAQICSRLKKKIIKCLDKRQTNINYNKSVNKKYITTPITQFYSFTENNRKIFC